MFKPGHWHHSHPFTTADVPAYSVDLFYEVRQDPAEGAMLHMRLEGQIAGQVFSETFELHRDSAFNFASVVSRVAHRHGLPVATSLIKHGHHEYDLVYEDIRSALGVRSGESVNLDTLRKDGF
ncbi:DUF5064 family protein [Pseudomonas sp. TTU2014-080ASC]|uniref:DUF5064 family protein n=1 Tax=Pseudomonas sp. TTU2014-080ASC TaxID=1729724 RepID=UPI000718470A|nr:DUF5064 family protein [Pseudomonas sp. TTU2014-080ASC]KRW62297.1 acetyl-CoA carboxylase alpha subunit [Pseudomonas sp. TTU2014-080ASC]